jgi:hypothetical protein
MRKIVFLQPFPLRSTLGFVLRRSDLRFNCAPQEMSRTRVIPQQFA